MAFISSHFYYSVDYYIINFENHCKWNEDFFSNICFTTPHLKGQKPFVIPANQTVSILFDQAFNTTAYPELNVSGGKG